jgi:hypothetical protein
MMLVVSEAVAETVEDAGAADAEDAAEDVAVFLGLAVIWIILSKRVEVAYGSILIRQFLTSLCRILN